MKSMAKPKRGQSTATIDGRVGGRIRERRIMLGLTQQQLAEMIGVTYQQAHKYERGINRVSAGRLFEKLRLGEASLFSLSTPSRSQAQQRAHSPKTERNAANLVASVRRMHAA